MDDTAISYIGRVNAARGKRNEAEKVIAQLNQIAKRRYVTCSLRSSPVFGEKDRALESLEEAFKAQDIWIRWIKVDPIFDDLRPDLRFVNLLRRVGLGS
jgi:hypothetical protein